MVVFLLHLELAQMLRELLELLVAHPSVAVLIEVVYDLVHIGFWRRWAVHHHEQFAQSEVHLPVVQVPTAISVILPEYMVSMLL